MKNVCRKVPLFDDLSLAVSNAWSRPGPSKPELRTLLIRKKFSLSIYSRAKACTNYGTFLLRHHFNIVVRTMTQTPEFKFGTRGSFKWFVFCFYLPRNKKNRYCSMPLQIAANWANMSKEGSKVQGFMFGLSLARIFQVVKHVAQQVTCCRSIFFANSVDVVDLFHVRQLLVVCWCSLVLYANYGLQQMSARYPSVHCAKRTAAVGK